MMAEINHPVNLNKYKDTIANNPPSKGDDWNLSCYSKLKAEVKEYYSIIQNDKCCYCKINLRHGGYGEPIEHIVPKKDKPKWMFEPNNLALSCYTCNTKKNADNTLSDSGKSSDKYPKTEKGFSIYQPHFNNWDNHFDFFYQYFLKPTSEKGRETFKVCSLYRTNLPLDKAKQRNWEEEPFKIKVIEKVLLDPTSSSEIIKQCNKISKEIIKRAKRKKEILGST